TFSEVKDDALEFDRVDVFNDWAHRFLFERIIAPEGGHGLIANAYHIKVTVRDDDTFWLSSGNWKMSSSQPLITQTQRDEATRKDLPGNREWHVVIRNKKLADRFRAHILQDFQRSKDLGGDTLPKRLRDETFVDVPLEEAVTLERPAPRGILKPKTLKVRAKVRLLLTPDREGEVYSEAVLTLIRSARTSLLFQIPYISISPNPSVDRGYIDALIQALVDKLITLEDARVILRSGGKEFSSPQHVAWFLKSKGVDISRQLRVIEDHHTKGMIVDGRRLLLGSHNWSGPGVTLNRDASLIIEAREAAEYYAEAFEIDWERASPVKARKFVRRTTAVREAVGESPPAGFQRIRLADWLKDE
ncbi:MAG: phospholipase D-like domain-containing protein, partial [Planctomycetaceae bacterium]